MVSSESYIIAHAQNSTFNRGCIVFCTQSVDANHSGKITAQELNQALLNNNWSHFNPETCRLLIGMFDQDK